MKTKKANIKIMQQGAPVVKGGIVIIEGKNIIAMLIDLKSKHCAFGGATGGDDSAPGVLVDATPDSMNLHKTNHNTTTEIVFPDYMDWNVFAVNIVKYTMSVCLIKPSN